MGKCVVYRRADNSVVVGHPSPSLVAQMTGDGNQWGSKYIDAEIERLLTAGLLQPGEAAEKARAHLLAVAQANIEAEIGRWMAAGLTASVARNFVEGLAQGGITETEAVSRILAKDQPLDAIAASIEDDSVIPSDRYFRAAWESAGLGISVNMSKARTMQMNNIRMSRDKELARLDAEYLQAVEKDDTSEKARLAALRQRLRNIPQTFDLTPFTTPAALKAAWPPEVPQP